MMGHDIIHANPWYADSMSRSLLEWISMFLFILFPVHVNLLDTHLLYKQFTSLLTILHFLISWSLISLTNIHRASIYKLDRVAIIVTYLFNLFFTQHHFIVIIYHNSDIWWSLVVPSRTSISSSIHLFFEENTQRNKPFANYFSFMPFESTIMLWQ